MPEIEECHRISGEFPVLLKMWAYDLQHLERLLDGPIRTRSGVVRTEVWIVLSSPKDHVTGLMLGSAKP
jgi:DNA-binding Lrp family transcriptional regulator